MVTGLLTFLLQNVAGDVGALGWWDLFINFGYSSCNYAVMLPLVIVPSCRGAINSIALKFHFRLLMLRKICYFLLPAALQSALPFLCVLSGLIQ